jgi:hypothetical protein
MKFSFTFLLFALCLHSVFGLNAPLENLEKNNFTFKISSDTVPIPASFQVIYPAGQSVAYESCGIETFIRISRTNGDTSQPLIVPVSWSGTATANLDYLVSYTTVAIPTGQFFIDTPIFVFLDNETESIETVVITLNDSCACVTDTLRIQDLPALLVTANDVTIQAGETVTIAPNVIGGAAPFSYNWANGSTTASIEVGAPGYYFVTVTDQCGQTAIGAPHVSYPDTSCTYDDPIFMPDGAFAELPLVIHGATNPTLGVNGQSLCGVKLNFDHEYIGDLTIVLKAPSGQTVQLVGPVGIFGPTDFTTWQVTFLPCSGVSEPDPGFAPQWNNNQPWGLLNYYTGSYYPANGCLESFTGAVNGTWSISIVDAQAIDVGNFYSYELVFCDPSGINCTFCSINSPITYVKPRKVACVNGAPFIWDELPHVTLSTPGTYELSSNPYTSASGCDSIVKQTIVVINPAASIIPGPTQLNCSRDSIVLSAESQYNNPGTTVKTWTNLGTGEIQQTDYFTVRAPGTYRMTNTVTVDSTSCSYSETVEITSDPNLLEMFAIGGNQGCAGNIVQLDYYPGDAFWTFNWTGPNGFTSNSPKPFTDVPGDYTLVVSNGMGCSASSVATVTPGAPPSDVTAQGGVLDCQTGFVQIFGNSSDPDVFYTWSGPDGFLSYEQNPFVPVSGVYKVTVTALNGCTNMAEALVLDPPPPPSIGLVTPIVVSCAVPAQLVCLTNAVMPSFYWSGPENFSSTEAKPFVYIPGLYTIIVTDGSSNCSASATFQVEGDTAAPLFLAIQVVQPTNGQDNGSINLTTNGAPGTVSYLWYYNGSTFPYAFTEDIENLAPGYYACVVMGANGCSNVAYFILENTVATHTVSDVSPWRIRPNPSPGRFVLCCNKDAGPISQLRVYESGGRLIREQTPGKMQDEYLIDLTEEAEGVYFLEVRGEEGSVWMKLVVAR